MNGACARDVRMRDARARRPWQAESARRVPAYQPVHAMAEPACSPQLSPPARRTHAGAQHARMPVCATQAPCENVITLSRWHDIHAPLGELDGEALRRRLPHWDGVGVLAYNCWVQEEPAWFEMQAALQSLAQVSDAVVVDAGHGLEIEHVPALVEASHIVVAELTVLGLARAKAHIEWLRRNGERNMARAQEPPRPGEEWKPIVGVPGRVIGVLCVEPPAVAKGRGAVSLEEARKYLQMEHMECELMGPVRSDARLCGDILEGLGIRRVHRRNARVLGDVAEMVERACGIGGR